MQHKDAMTLHNIQVSLMGHRSIYLTARIVHWGTVDEFSSTVTGWYFDRCAINFILYRLVGDARGNSQLSSLYLM